MCVLLLPVLRAEISLLILLLVFVLMPSRSGGNLHGAGGTGSLIVDVVVLSRCCSSCIILRRRAHGRKACRAGQGRELSTRSGTSLALLLLFPLAVAQECENGQNNCDSSNETSRQGGVTRPVTRTRVRRVAAAASLSNIRPGRYRLNPLRNRYRHSVRYALVCR